MDRYIILKIRAEKKCENYRKKYLPRSTQDNIIDDNFEEKILKFCKSKIIKFSRKDGYKDPQK